MAQKATENDALGGAGSIKDQLISVAINGLSSAIDGRVRESYPLASFNETATVNAEGKTTPSGSPQAPKGTGGQVVEFFSNPVALAIGAAVALSVIVIYAVRR